MKHCRVALDYGHGGEKPGAVYAGIEEKAMNLQLGNLIYRDLHQQSHDDPLNVVLTRDADEHIPLRVRYQLINQYHQSHPLQLVVSIHYNAAPTVPSAKGFEVYYLQGSKNGSAAARAIVESVAQQGFNIRGRGYKTTAELGRKLAMIHKTAPPSVLIETGFLSNDEDRKNAIDPDWQQTMANAITQGIWHYLRA